MRHGTAQHHRVQHSLALKVVDEAAGALEKPRVFGPVDGLPDQRPHTHRRAALSVRSVA